jgi:hypothetical protein
MCSGRTMREQGVCQLLACTSIHQIQSCPDFLQSLPPISAQAILVMKLSDKFEQALRK